MTENEAIARIIDHFDVHHHDNRPHPLLDKAVEMAIKALEEVQRYRQVGTVEECHEAVEKQTAKKPDYEGDGYSDGQLVYDTWICPCCGQHYEVNYDSYDYCPNCGQKLDWSDGDDGN